jgi:hypothetical protein
MIRWTPSVHNRLRIYEDCRGITENLPTCSVNEPVTSLSFKMTNKTEELDSLKTDQTLASSLSKT